MLYRHHFNKDVNYLARLTGPVEPFPNIYHQSNLYTEEGVGYWYRVGEYERQRGRAYSGISYVTIWYVDDFRQEYSPEFIKEMEIQEKVWQFKLLFKKLEI
jgi:hypothetical protein